jgi:indole-3-glycerol phosphate synthase
MSPSGSPASLATSPLLEAAGERVAEILRRIVDSRWRRCAGLGSAVVPEELSAAEASEAVFLDHPFLNALRRSSAPAVIAEVKMGSPRIGSLVGRVEPEEQARIYRDHGAAALSVVVEPDFFFGSLALLERCKRASGLPAVAKDFVVHPEQMRQAREAGADAILLIAALYDGPTLARLGAYARSLGLVPLVETHDSNDVAKLGTAPWELVGVNNRDLRTFEVDLSYSEALLPRLPVSALKVAESGLRGRQEIRRLSRAGFDAFLIGESLLLAPDPAAKLRELLA